MLDTGVFIRDRYFDIFVEYAKAAPADMLIRIRIGNRGPDEAVVHVLPDPLVPQHWAWWPDEPKPFLKARVAGLHDRIPVILTANNWPARLGETAADPDHLKSLLAPYPADDMVIWPVDKRVGNVKNKGRSLIEPEAAAR